MNMNILRPAIAMIELIFAIVIMGIVMMSAPMLISTATQSSYVALQQEGINEAASRVNMIMGYAWDEKNTDDECIPPILHVTDGDVALKENGNTARRIGIPVTSQRTFICIGTNSNTEFDASTLGAEGGDSDDIDDFTGDISLTPITEATDDNDIDYVEKATVNINTQVAYISDSVTTGSYNSSILSYTPFTSASPTTNIKSIEVKLTSTSGIDELEKTIILRAFSCNIGGYKFEEKRF